MIAMTTLTRVRALKQSLGIGSGGSGAPRHGPLEDRYASKPGNTLGVSKGELATSADDRQRKVQW